MYYNRKKRNNKKKKENEKRKQKMEKEIQGTAQQEEQLAISQDRYTVKLIA